MIFPCILMSLNSVGYIKTFKSVEVCVYVFFVQLIQEGQCTGSLLVYMLTRLNVKN